jgi:uncharacterized protein (TIGR00255 family)
MTTSSMTGFARREGSLEDWIWAVEARSVNGRNLEVRFKGPNGFETLERLVRDAAQARFQRGQINVTIQARASSSARRSNLNLEILERYIAFGESFVAAGRAVAPRIDGLLALPGVIEISDNDAGSADHGQLESAMAGSVAEALDALKQSRAEEGRSIARVLTGFLDAIESLITAAEVEASQQPALIKARFERRLIELLGDSVTQDRIVQEAAVMAVKTDVREEMDRLIGHVAAARNLLAADGASGRRLDFLTQEFMREANTLCSKSAVSALTNIGLELKATIDQFREQVQNVE